VRVLKSPVTLFLLVGVLTVTGIVIGTGLLAGRAARNEADAEARNTARVVGAFVVAPKVGPDLLRGRSGAVDRFDTQMLGFLKDSPIDHVAIIDRSGRIVYADDISRIGDRVRLTTSQQRVLIRGGTGSQDADPIDAGLPTGQKTDTGRLLQTWTGLRPRGTPPLLLEAYFSLENVQTRRQEIYSSFRWITIGPLLLLMLVVVLMLRVLTRQIARGAAERERLLRSAIDASDAERRRIARDLHDGVVQDLAGTAFSVSALSRDPHTSPENRSSLQGAARSLRDGLKSLRSLLAEIHPPELRSEGLAAALADLTAPAAASGIQASVSVEGAETASDQRAALVWRVAQEAVRNALRHSAASTLAVTVRGDGRRLNLEVVDDGVGFDPDSVTDLDRYGLRGLRSLVADSGGTLEVRSSPREGTTVRMEVEAQ
jgi:two-component system, NarL family, sensor kinase